MNKATLAKLVAWAGGALVILSANNLFGKYSPFVAQGAALFTAGGTHIASNTSEIHPDGKQ
jgi:hypothetical protein